MSQSLRSFIAAGLTLGFLWAATTEAEALSPASQSISRGAGVKENRSFVYHGKIVRPDGSTPTGSMSVTLKILSPDPKLCVLWAETQTIEMKEGGFSAELGHGINRLPGASGGAAADFKQAFVNNASLTISGAQCASGNSYTPTASDDRLMTATFNDSGSVIEIAGLPIKSVPFALQAEEVAGFGIANLAKISGAGSSVTYSPAEISTLKDLLGGDVFFDMKSRVVKNVAAPVDPNDAANKSWVLSQISSSGGGTVSSVGFTVPSIFSVSGSPVTSTGSIGLTLANQSANAVFAGPTSGGGAAPTFRALVPADVPALDASKITSGSLADALIPSMDASKITTGTFSTAQIPSLDASKIGSGTFAAARIPSLDASKIGSGILSADRGGTGLAPAVADGNKVYGLASGGMSTEFKSVVGAGTVSVSHTAGTITITGAPGADNLGTHVATQNLDLGSFKLVGNGGASGISVAAGGNVGVGTSSPQDKLEVAGGLRLNTNSTSAPTINFYGDTDSTNRNIGYISSSWNPSSDATRAGSISFYGRDFNGTAQPLWTGAGTSGGGSSTLYAGNSAAVNVSILSNSSFNVLNGSDNVFRVYHLNTDGIVTVNNDSKNYDFRVNGNGVGPTIFSKASTGNVGIGTTTPSEKLEVVGGKIKSPEYCIGASCITSWPSVGGGGTVTSVGVGGLPLSVTNATSTPQISIAQANTTTAGYLSAADWNTFNGKQPAGSYLSQTLAANQVFVGNGSNVATSSFFGIEQMRNASGVAQFPSACTASQTLTWSAITDTLSCTNINNLDADKITAGTIATARLGSGTADSTTFLRGDGIWAVPAGGGGGGTLRRAQVTLASNTGIAHNTTTALTFPTPTVDTSSFWAAGQPTRLTIPAGVSKVRLCSNLYFAGPVTTVYAVHSGIRKNGSTYASFGGNHTTYNAMIGIPQCTSVQDVTTGDYFELVNYQNSGSSATIYANQTWLSVEEVSAGGGGGSGTPGGSTTQLQFNDAGSFAGASGFVWDKTNARVGIGTTTPNSPLEVAGIIHSTTGGIKFPDGTVQTTSATSGTNNTMITNVPDAIVCSSGSDKMVFFIEGSFSTAIMYRSIFNTATDYYLQFYPNGNYWTSNASSYDCTTNAWSITQLKTSGKAFNLAKGPAGQWLEASGNAYRNTGNVGIGTASPAKKLHVADDIVVDALANANSSMRWYTGGVEDWVMYRPANTDDLRIHEVMVSDHVTFKAGGNVGIGTVSPGSKLEVAGTIHSTSGGVKFPDGTTQTTAAGSSTMATGMAYRTAAFNTTAAGTFYDIPLNAGNTLVNVTHSTSTNPERMTATIAGTYEVTYRSTIYGQAAAYTCSVRLMKNGVEVPGSYAVASTGASWGGMNVGATAVVALAVNDYVVMQGACDANYTNEFNCHPIGSPGACTVASMTIKRVSP